jgi:phenylacetate-coenzyme A ligase PaaK-like adenylate-forming protein
MSENLPQGYWNPKIELMPRRDLEALQLKRLKVLIAYAWERCPFYRRKMAQAHITPDDVATLGDFFASFPVTTRDELNNDQREHPPYGSRLSVEPADTIRFHATSGSTGGERIKVLDTERDWLWGAGCWASALYNFGLRRDDIVLVTFGYGTFIGFWGAHYAFDKIGCKVIPAGPFDTKTRLRMLQETGATVLACTPSYAMRLAYVAEELGLDLRRETQVRKLVCGGEPGATIPSTRKRLEEAFGASAGDFMGTTETAGIIGFTCFAQSEGLHINEDRFITEVLDSETFEARPYGERGVMVVTPLIKQAMPLLRYVTNDAAVKAHHDNCGCGRTFDILKGGILGRYDDRTKVRGVFIMPPMIEEVIRQYPDIEEFYTTVENVQGLDTLVIKLDPKSGLVENNFEEIAVKVGERIKTHLGIRPIVQTVAHGTLPRYEAKSNRFKDLRVKENRDD